MFKYVILLLLVGCSLTPNAPNSASTYDFGPISRSESLQPTSSPIPIQIAGIIAPAWLDTQAMRYRLAYYHPAQTYVYANNRWAAPPASLLAERFKQHSASWKNISDQRDSSTRLTTYFLKIELEEFIQVFDTVDHSHAIVSLRASLIERDTRRLVAHQRFSKSQPTPSPDASGAVEAFIAISDQLAAELIQWSTQITAHPQMLPK